MADEEKQPTRLQVATMRPEDSGRGLARLPRRIMTALGLSEGDVIEVTGKRGTPARAVGPTRRTKGSTSSAWTASSGPTPKSVRAIT
jgi:transitional endoplasmic reticulum ATPase